MYKILQELNLKLYKSYENSGILFYKNDKRMKIFFVINLQIKFLFF